MSLNPLVHKITIAIVLLTIGMTYFGPLLPITEQAQVAIMGFLGAIGAFIKTGQEPPKKAGS